MNATTKSLRQISLEWGANLRSGRKPFYGELANLLDDFRGRCPAPEDKIALVADRPEPTGEPETDAYLAAVAESLCREIALPPPAWTEASAYYLSRPWFAGDLQSLKAILLTESPVCFRRRNLFVSANALQRV
jgi:hypothetical protein